MLSLDWGHNFSEWNVTLPAYTTWMEIVNICWHSSSFRFCLFENIHVLTHCFRSVIFVSSKQTWVYPIDALFLSVSVRVKHWDGVRPACLILMRKWPRWHISAIENIKWMASKPGWDVEEEERERMKSEERFINSINHSCYRGFARMMQPENPSARVRVYVQRRHLKCTSASAVQFKKKKMWKGPLVLALGRICSTKSINVLSTPFASSHFSYRMPCQSVRRRVSD